MINNRIGLLQIVLTALGFLVGIASNAFANFIVGLKSWSLVFAVGFLVLSVLIWGLLKLFRKSITRVGVYKQFTLRTDQEKIRQARSGIIVVVPWYTPPNNTKISDKNKKILVQKIREGAEIGNYELMDFQTSNFGHLVQAISTHQSKIKNCWLLSTENINSEMPGSKVFIPALIQYLKNELGMNDCCFHWEDFSIVLDDDSAVTEKTKDMVTEIFNKSSNAKDIIADFTGGPRSMALGVFLACLDSQRDLQFIGTHYNESGGMTGSPFPLITEFSVQIEE